MLFEIFSKPKPFLPADFPENVAVIMERCIQSDVHHRVSMPEILKRLKIKTSKNKGIVEIILENLEAHNEKLEERVDQRRQELQQVR